MKKIILLLVFISCISSAKTQQIPDSIKMFIPEIDSVCSGSSVYIPIKAINFRNVMSMQGSIRWDSTVLNLDSAFINNNIPFFDSLKIDTNVNLTKSFISYVLVNANSNYTAQDSTTIFTLRFKIINKSKISTPIYFSNNPTQFGIDTAADVIGLSDLASLTGNNYINGKINFVDTPTIIQNGNLFTCIASCIPAMYIWNTYDCSGNLLRTDTTITNVFVSTLPSGTCFSIQCAARYGNGNAISSIIKHNILPLKLLSFTARKESNRVLLNWQTTNEANVSHINVQRAIDKDFTTIGKINVGISTYKFLDDKLPIATDKLTLNYRLEIVDKDGSKTYSEIEQVNIQLPTYNISAYPNPAKDIVTIESKGAKKLTITDCFGRVVHNADINRTSYIINLKPFAKGVYIISFDTGEKVKLVKD